MDELIIYNGQIIFHKNLEKVIFIDQGFIDETTYIIRKTKDKSNIDEILDNT